jgi:hypothetical protein
MLWDCPVCPHCTDDPFGWLRFRTNSAAEFEAWFNVG